MESRVAYRRLVYEQAQFLRVFQAVTPIDVIERMQIGSRSVHRVKAQVRGSAAGAVGVSPGRRPVTCCPLVRGRSALRAALASFGLARLRAACDGWFFLRTCSMTVETHAARLGSGIAPLLRQLVPSRCAASPGDPQRV